MSYGINSNSMEAASFSNDTPMSWSMLSEMPFQDRNGGGRWECQGNKSWGVMQQGANNSCSACPPCKVDRFPTRLMLRDNGIPCSTPDCRSYQTNWPWQFQYGSNMPNASHDYPLWQDLLEVKRRSSYDYPLAPIFNPFTL